MLGSVIADLYRGWKQRRAAARPIRAARTRERSSNGPVTAGWHVFGDATQLQATFDVAIVMPTVLRPSVTLAVESIFNQASSVRTQLLIGIDAPAGSDQNLVGLLRRAPHNVTTCLFYPGYSTSVRHGGLQFARDGGALRSVLTYLANARRVAYLDDDNSWHPDHLATMLEAIEGHDWAYSLRWFAHPRSREPICPDIWESVGPGEGLYAARFGGWVDPNCLMFDKIACDGAIRWWCTPLTGDPNGMSGDRRVYDYLQRHGEPGCTRRPTVYYTLQPNDIMHSERVKLMGQAYVDAERNASFAPQS